jgi:DNA-binding MurR/RpiR family transcriptional regulator
MRVAFATAMTTHVENTTGSPAERLAGVSGPTERAVVQYLLQQGPRAATMSAREIAAAVGTSDATVVRAARSLGYESLRQLRDALADQTDTSDLSSRLRATLGGRPAAHDVLARTAQHQLRALDLLLGRVSSQEFDAATRLLAKASHVWWSGVGPSAHIAGYGAFLCRRLGTPSGAFTHAGTDHADELLALQRGHAVVVLAYGRVHPPARVLLEHAAHVGATTVLVTDSSRPRLTHPADIVLDAGRGAADLFATHGPTVVLVEALVLAIAADTPRRADRSLTTLNELRRSIAGRRMDVDPS